MKGVNFYSISREIEVGERGAELFAQSTTLLRDPKVSQYLTALGEELAAVADQIQFPYSFTVFRGVPPTRLPAFPLDYQDFNEALSLAGGPIFIPARLVEKLDSEPALAAVLAQLPPKIAGATL